MGQLSKDMVLKLAFAEVSDSNRKLLGRILTGTDGVTAFELAEDGTLVVSLHSEDGDEGLSRALAAAGLFPVSMENLGTAHKGGMNAC